MTVDTLTKGRLFPHEISPETGAVAFATIADSEQLRAPFLDDRLWAPASPAHSMSMEDVLDTTPQPLHTEATAYIFHSAFCGSTLMARALGALPATFSLSEPNILVEFAHRRRYLQGWVNNARQQAFENRIYGMLHRRIDDRPFLVIKPSNFANNLINDIVNRGHPVVLMYGDLQSFLLSMIKREAEAQTFLNKLLTTFAADGLPVGTLAREQLATLDILHLAALLWRQQLEVFSQIVANAPAGRVRTVSYREFVSDPASVLKAATHHFSIPVEDEHLEGILEGPVFRLDSKSHGTDTPDYRISQTRDLAAANKSRIDPVLAWADKTSLGTSLHLPLAGNLVEAVDA